MERRAPALLLQSRRPPLPAGIAAAVAAIAVTTALLFPIGQHAPSVSLGVVYLLGVLLISTYWGAWLGVATGIGSALAFNYFHISPTGRFTIADAENWVALGVFLVAAVLASSLAELARSRAAEAEERRREADLGAELAQLLLGSAALSTALEPAAERIAAALALPHAELRLAGAPQPPPQDAIALPIARDGEPVGELLVPQDTPQPVIDALTERLAPGLATLLGAALDREALTREVVETRALRRSDEIKTALLRTVSHDLRSPLTGILTAAEAVGSPAIDADERRELADGIAREASRLAGLVDKLLDLSRLQAGQAPPRRDWCSLDEVIRAAVEDLHAAPEQVKLALDRDLPLIEADPAQIERAFANLIENALRYSCGQQVSVRGRVSGGRILLRVVDRGPGIPLAEQERIFEPFYRAQGGDSRAGSGLGLAIVRGFIEANGGRVRVESLPGQGTSFVVEFPLPQRPPAPVAEGAASP